MTEEGYVTMSGSTPMYHYYLKDHLGSNRVVISSSGTVEQTTHYYPFGGVFDQTGEELQRYKFGGKELDREFGLDLYDYSARYMDGALGKFTTVDPLAEKYYSISPYGYCANNPVRFIDPTGMDWYENDLGNAMWIRSQEEDYTDENGTIWKNIGKEYLYINRNRAILFQQETSDKGNLVLKSSIFDIDAEPFKPGIDRDAVLNMQSSNWSRTAAQQFWNNPTIGNFVSYAFKEVLSQYTRPELVVTGLSVGITGYSNIIRGSARATNAINNTAQEARSWLGGGYKVITNSSGDKIFISSDGLRRFRLDIINPRGDAPHVHLEILRNGRWRDAIYGTHRIYPKK